MISSSSACKHTVLKVLTCELRQHFGDTDFTVNSSQVAKCWEKTGLTEGNSLWLPEHSKPGKIFLVGKRGKGGKRMGTPTKDRKEDTRGWIKPFTSPMGSPFHLLHLTSSLDHLQLHSLSQIPNVQDILSMFVQWRASNSDKICWREGKKFFSWMCFLKSSEGMPSLEVTSSPVASQGPQRGWHTQASLRGDRLPPTSCGCCCCHLHLS